MSSIRIIVEVPKTTYIGGERIEGNLCVKVPANSSGPVHVPGIVINAGSRTILSEGKADEDANKAKRATVVEPYKQQLRVVMPKGGAKDLSLAPGSTTNYPFALILPPDLLPSYYSAVDREDDGTRFVASLIYLLAADLATACGVTVESEPVQIYMVPVALPYGPQPRKGYLIPVYNHLAEPVEGPNEGNADGAEDGPSTSDKNAQNIESEHQHEAEEEHVVALEDKKKKSSVGCGGGKKKDAKRESEKDNKESVRYKASEVDGSVYKQTKTKTAPSPAGVKAGQVKVALTMQTAYICLRPNVGEGKDGAAAGGADNNSTMWVEMRLTNMLKTEDLPFIVRLTLKLVTVYKPTDGSDTIEKTLVLSSRTARAILPSHSGDETLQLKPGEATPMRLSLAVPQALALAECEALKIPKADAGAAVSRHPEQTAVPPTVESTTFDARTLLEVEVLPLAGRTKNNEHIVYLEDPVEIVGLPGTD